MCAIEWLKWTNNFHENEIGNYYQELPHKSGADDLKWNKYRNYLDGAPIQTFSHEPSALKHFTKENLQKKILNYNSVDEQKI